MKNFIIFILLILLGFTCFNWLKTFEQLEKVQNDYINLIICIQEDI